MSVSDKVTLQIGNQRIENFVSYNINADLYQAADNFTLELANPEAPVKAGMQCKLYVNNELALNGLIDKTVKKYDKGGSTLVVDGRDLMGMLVDSYCETFPTLQDKKLSDLVEYLVFGNEVSALPAIDNIVRPPIPYISRSEFTYQKDVVGKLKGKKKTADSPLTTFLDTPQELSKIDPGMTVFEVLSVYAASRGMMFWLDYRQDGMKLVFGRPKIKGEPRFIITTRLDGRGNNVESGEEINDISRRYSKVTVISQVQKKDGTWKNERYPAFDKEFPFYKPFVTQINNDSKAPELFARMLIEKQRHDGYSLNYVAPLHSQNGKNWSINELCTVNDEVLGIKQRTMLVVSRSFRKNKAGSWTDIRLGPPGLVAAPQ